MYKEIELEFIFENKNKLLAFGNINVYDIKSVWKSSLDIDIVDCGNIEYSWNLPLYAKMIIRFQNNNNSPIRLHKQIDHHNQSILRAMYNLYNEKHLLDFFGWIEDSLGAYHILELENQNFDSDSSDYVKRWRTSSIKFFFWLDEKRQKNLIDRYNKNVIKWNDILQ